MTELFKTLQQYPKTFNKFVDWLMSREDSYCFWDDMILEDERLVSVYECNGLLTDFCDGEGYYVYVYPIKGQDGHYWHYAINFEDGSRFFSAEKLKLEDEIKPFDSRQEAFEQGIIKAFSLMENK